eukprot:TRINITY_DN75_c0_g1_i1.p1 TRINITY_DN75_c0_g1~~TRINITY_DN75_c0_g1_i1.p1  ORF type:complete len:781 (+),score=268.95 TRINITY_DN75_c0_g1_i1:86-2428(+)
MPGGLLVGAATAAAAAVNFQSISCPYGTFAQGCQYQNRGTSDEAVSFFFQFEPRQGETSGSFECTGDGMTYCSRSWQAEASGSAGDCFFLLGAGRSFSCSGQGTVNVLGAHAAPMTSSVLASSPSQADKLPCSGSGGCKYSNSGKDAWVQMAFSASSNATLSCKYGSMEVCNWGVNGAGGGGSCGFILPTSAELSCQGDAKITSAAALRFSEAVLDVDAKLDAQWNCPKKTYPKTNMCDCDITNTYTDKDLAVMVTAQSVDGNFNSFHCGYDGVNVCAWGTDRNDQTDKGGCYFLLPAGENIQCQMQWGAVSFSYSAAVATKKAFFGSSTPKARKALPAVPAANEQQLRRMFAEWKGQHGKVYGSAAEEEVRFANFREHVTLAGRKGRYNHMADMSREQFEKSYRGCGRVSSGVNRTQGWQPSAAEAVLPKSVDWRTKHVVTAVKDQGQCGSCWSFSTTGAIESAWAISGQPLQSLSEQELVSCDNRDGNQGCGGGWPDKAMTWVQQNGIDTEESYPYASGSGTAPGCTGGHTKAAAKVTGHKQIASDEDAMAAWVAANGPLSICVAAMTQLWWPYTGGIMTGCCNTECDHAVLIVGFGEENGQKYWLIKNSWNANWGENGYLRLERGTNQCGITTAPVAALVGGAPTPKTPAPGPSPPGPSPVTPAPPTPPTPPGDCPAQAVKKGSSCMWVNGTNGVVLPPAAQLEEYCDYFSKGYFGYLWPKSASTAAQYPCPTAAAASSSTADNFCVFDNGSSGVQWPAGAKAECGQLKEGTLGYSW